jgi:putative methyltransferase (TIGR04325 family)
LFISGGAELKQIVKKLVENLPIVSDYYAYYWLFPRKVNAFRGLYASFDEALKAVPVQTLSGYNHSGLHDHPVRSNCTQSDMEKLNPIDYPVLVWLRKAFEDSATVCDLGGNTGNSYYAFRRYIAYPENLQWTICDLPEAVKAGEAMRERTHCPGLSFTTSLATVDADIFLTCGAIQYMETSFNTLLSQLKTPPRHLIVQRVAFYDGEEYFTLQNLWGSYAPYRIFNDAQFVAAITALGYELVDRWRIDRPCVIPFHPDCFVEGQSGMYFRLAT